jgi:hypothetical protein
MEVNSKRDVSWFCLFPSPDRASWRTATYNTATPLVLPVLCPLEAPRRAVMTDLGGGGGEKIIPQRLSCVRQ